MSGNLATHPSSKGELKLISTKKQARAAQVHYNLDITFIERVGTADYWHIRFEEPRKERFYEAIGDIRAYGGWWDSKAFGGLGGWRVPYQWFIDRADHVGASMDDVYENLCYLYAEWALRQFARQRETPQSAKRARYVPIPVQQAYKTLKLTVGADMATVKRQYRKLALQNHPDKGGNHTAMATINAAYNRIVEYLQPVA